MYALDLRATRSDWPAVAVLGGAVKTPPRALTGQGQLAEPLRGRRTGQRCPPREPEFLAVVETRDAVSLPRMEGNQAVEPSADVADKAAVNFLDHAVGGKRREGRGRAHGTAYYSLYPSMPLAAVGLPTAAVVTQGMLVV